MRLRLLAALVSLLLLPALSAAQTSQVVFTEVGAQANLAGDTYSTAGDHGLGVNWIDYNLDSRPDLFVTNGIGRVPHLFANNGDGTFSPADQLLPTLPDVEMMGSVFADFENDGDPDIYIFTHNVLNTALWTPNLLLRNLWVENGFQALPGQPLFEEIAVLAGVNDAINPPTQLGSPAATGGWLDFDRDGNIDLYVCHLKLSAQLGEPAERDRLFRNLGNGTFEDASALIYPLDSPSTSSVNYRSCLAFIAAHLNSDSYPDLYVANVLKPLPYELDQIYQNQGGVSFVDQRPISPGVGDDSGAAMGVTVADVDLDGDWDVAISDIGGAGHDPAGVNPPYGNPFYRNLGADLGTPDIVFAENSADVAGIEARSSWGIKFFDADQDGWEDLFVATSGGTDIFYRNDGDGTFTDISSGAGLLAPGNGRGAAVADYDADGDLDIAVVNEDGPLQLYRNDTVNSGNSLKVRLVAGPSTNRSAINALVRVSAGGKDMMRQLIGGDSAHSQDALELHFGLGSATVADQIEVEWPSGAISVLADVAAGVVTIDEASGSAAPETTITTPQNQQAFGTGVAISFVGSAADHEDGDLTGSLSWSSNLDGVIGAGGGFSATLSDGTHTITAEVVDSDGFVDSDSVTISVGNTPPSVSIGSPADGASTPADVALDFAGTADDVVDGDLTAALVWTSSLDGVIGTGGSFSAFLSEGTHTITAAVTSTSGLAGSDSIAVEVSPPIATDATFTSNAAQDGLIAESSETSGVGLQTSSSGTGPGALRVGDFANDTQAKTIFSFDTSSIPDDATVTSATLRMRRGQLSGTNPFDTHGACLVDVSEGGFGGNPALAGSDFQAAATATAAGTMTNPVANGDWSEGVLTAAGRAAISTTGFTQLRVYFELDDNDNGVADSIGFYSGDHADPANHPQLVLTYVVRPSAARQWNELTLGAIRRDFARPTIHARNLYHTAVAMWDAWAAYDGTAGQVLHHEEASAADVEAARAEAISYAAYRLLSWRFANSPGRVASLQSFDDLMDTLGYDRAFTSTAGDSPAALGNRIAETVIDYGLSDNSNEAGGYANLHYVPVNPPLLPDLPGNPDIVDPNRWQPLALNFFIDQSGNVIVGGFPPALSPEWGQVKGFALSPSDLAIYNRDGFDYWVYHDPGPPPLLDSPLYKSGFEQVVEFSGYLDPTDGVMIDIGPGGRGNNTLGTNDGQGYSVNPVTGEPYAPNFVPAGDYYRVLAEFWADGPQSETPPGHWFTLANYVSDHPQVEKRLGGTGPVLDDLEWDVKVYLSLGGALHDVAVTVWGVKGWYDYVRPVSAIRFMCDQGQSSDPQGSSYHPDGINLHPGSIELVTAQTAAPGGIHEHLAGENGENIGKIAIRAWRGPDYIADPEVDTAGVGWILCEDWWPYQRPTFVTPPFPAYVSGHSTYSRAGAEVMSLLTGSEYFPGGLGVFHAAQNDYLVFEEGPSVDLTLQWAKYFDAADESGLSRIYGGIHPTQDDIPGRLIGHVVGPNAFAQALRYFNGELGFAPTVTITGPADGSVVPAGASVDFSGSASDAGDGDISAALVWTSDLDGTIGAGGSFSTTLSTGVHSITASATATSGLTGSDSITVEVTSGAIEATFVSVGAEDGMVRESSETSGVGGAASTTGAGPGALRAGDSETDAQSKMLLSFDTSSLPDGATIVAATLRVRRGRLLGTNPFDTHGACLVDVSNGGFGGSPALVASDFQAAATATAVATMSNPQADGDWSEGTLGATGLAAINATGATQFRVYFTLDDNDDLGEDEIGHHSGDASDPANRPQLVVSYVGG